MEEIKSAINEKVTLIENFIALSLRREKVHNVAVILLRETEELQKLMDRVRRAIKNDVSKVDEQHGRLIIRMQRQQSALLSHILTERRRKVKEAETREHEMQVALKVSNVPRTAERLGEIQTYDLGINRLNLYSSEKPTKLTLTGYKASPLVKQRPINPIPFTFLDFEYLITTEQFESIPKYMRGRESVDDLRSFLDTIIVPCFNKKYQLMYRQRSTVRNRHDLELWKVYNQQVSYVPGRNFITAGDISQQMQKMLDKKQQNRIVMLRHLGVIQEQRVGQTVCYIWNADSH